MELLEPRSHLFATIAIRCVAFGKADHEIARLVHAVVYGGSLILISVGAQRMLRNQGELREYCAVPSIISQ
jgi:hypothetical protein